MTLLDLWIERGRPEEATVLSPTLATIASLNFDTAAYWGSEAQAQYGERVYRVLHDLSALPRPLIAALGTVWKSLLFADDICPARVSHATA